MQCLWYFVVTVIIIVNVVNSHVGPRRDSWGKGEFASCEHWAENMGDTQEAFMLCLKKPLGCCHKAAVVRTKPHVFAAPIIVHSVQWDTTGQRLWWGKACDPETWGEDIWAGMDEAETKTLNPWISQIPLSLFCLWVSSTHAPALTPTPQTPSAALPSEGQLHWKLKLMIPGLTPSTSPCLQVHYQTQKSKDGEAEGFSYKKELIHQRSFKAWTAGWIIKVFVSLRKREE